MIGPIKDPLLLAEKLGTTTMDRRKLFKMSLAAGATLTATSLLAACGDEADDGVAAETGDDSEADEPEPDADDASEDDADEAPDDIVADATLTIPMVTTLDLTLDPNKALNYAIYGSLLPYIYSGLVVYDPDAVSSPDIAENWEVSDDGLEWTFHMQEAHFASGRRVTPEDCIYSYKRVLDPNQPASTTQYFEHVVGVAEYLEGEADEIEGFTIVDDQTLTVTLTGPYSFFLSMMCTFPWLVVDQELVEEHGDHNNSAWAVTGAYGAGPWKVQDFDPTTGLELEPNEYYFGGHSGSVSHISMPILRGPTADNTALNMYKADQAEVLPNFPLSLLDAVEQDHPDEIEWIVASGTESIAMNFDREPFDNVLVRRAFGMAIDRERYANELWRGTRTPTSCFTPPNVPDYECPEGIQYDPEEAQNLLAAAGYPDGEGLPPVTIYVSSDESGENVNRTRALAQMWTETLGADVEIDTSMTTSQIIDRRTEEKGLQLEIMGWINIQDTPRFVYLMKSDHPAMFERFWWGKEVEAMEYDGETYDPAAASAEFDELIEQAEVEQDEEVRNDLYYQAEELMLNNAVYVPMANYRFPSLTKPYVKGLAWGAYFYRLPHPLESDFIIEDA
jgi:oligopeptide transport system substrate-binding protein